MLSDMTFNTIAVKAYSCYQMINVSDAYVVCKACKPNMGICQEQIPSLYALNTGFTRSLNIRCYFLAPDLTTLPNWLGFRFRFRGQRRIATLHTCFHLLLSPTHIVMNMDDFGITDGSIETCSQLAQSSLSLSSLSNVQIEQWRGSTSGIVQIQRIDYQEQAWFLRFLHISATRPTGMRGGRANR